MEHRDYSQTANYLAEQAATLLARHPDAFSGVLYRAVAGSAEVLDPLTARRGASLQDDEHAVTYEDPVPVRLFELPRESHLILNDMSDLPLGFEEEPVTFLCSADQIPRGSIITYEEYLSQAENREVSMYVISSEGVGKAPVSITKYHCIPLYDATSIPGG